MTDKWLQAAIARSKKWRLDPIADLHDTVSAQQRADSVCREQDLAAYKALKVSVASDNQLLFWKDKAVDYPILSQAARRILCITASSAQSERDFSSVGRTVTDMKSCLSLDKVEAIELIHWGKWDFNEWIKLNMIICIIS